MLYLILDQKVTRKLVRHWVMDEEENPVFISGSVEECLEYLEEQGVKKVKALAGRTECVILIVRKLTREEVQSWPR